ncbi:FecR domain-containing protein [Bordetella sp. 02P26C-1]|uniref:FecR domain-containing protein n=1 Tax=Bordetella sp. 02P26C-1 TaxID=2683195 RepID=UPI001355F1E6|nr:FecR domain-containing protein [Bordetella sp. 02P26C-1]MVW80773.1 LysM peptidoglycan-binding domain-containing protein [Bordetella sp. 02P26C-1]
MNRRAFRLLAGCMALAYAPFGHAQPAGAVGDDFVYRIRPADTLIDLASRYTGDGANWVTLQKLNRVEDPQKLAIGLALHIPFSLIPVVPAPLTAIHVSGSTQMDGKPLRAGMSVPEGATIITESDGFATLDFADGTRLSLPNNSTARVDRTQKFKNAGLIDSVVSVQNGEVDSEVAPTGQGVGRFEIRTPVTIVGVRGTRFRLQATGTGAQSEVLHGKVDMSAGAGGSAPPVAVAGGQGAAVDVHGQIQVHTLPPAPIVTPPQRGASGQWVARVTPVPGAVAYLVRISRDPKGLEVFTSERFEGEEVRLVARRPGTHYASIRALNAAGLGGYDTVLSFEGASPLMSGSGHPVLLSDGAIVTLNNY